MTRAALTLCPLLSFACWALVIASACAPLPPVVQTEIDIAESYELCLRVSQCAPAPLREECYREAQRACLDAGQPRGCWAGQHLLSEWPSFEPYRNGCPR